MLVGRWLKSRCFNSAVFLVAYRYGGPSLPLPLALVYPLISRTDSGKLVVLQVPAHELTFRRLYQLVEHVRIHAREAQPVKKAKLDQCLCISEERMCLWPDTKPTASSASYMPPPFDSQQVPPLPLPSSDTRPPPSLPSAKEAVSSSPTTTLTRIMPSAAQVTANESSALDDTTTEDPSSTMSQPSRGDAAEKRVEDSEGGPLAGTQLNVPPSPSLPIPAIERLSQASTSEIHSQSRFSENAESSGSQVSADQASAGADAEPRKTLPTSSLNSEPPPAASQSYLSSSGTQAPATQPPPPYVTQEVDDSVAAAQREVASMFRDNSVSTNREPTPPSSGFLARLMGR
jgi:hypothetical protein